MRKLVILIVLLTIGAGIVNAQDADWQSNSNNSVEYNCTVVESLLSAFESGNEKSITDATTKIIARNDDIQVSTSEYIGSAVLILLSNNPKAEISTDSIFADASDACDKAATTTTVSSSEPVDEFNVVANGSVNLRSCGGTQCAIVRVTKNGEILTVTGVDGDWYEVKVDSGTAFISSQLTTRGPDDVIKVDEPYFDVDTSCFIIFDPKRGDMDINIIIAGEKQNDLLVDIYRPNETRPIKVEAQLDKAFSDTGDPYILQYYSYSVSWPLNGLYQLEYTIDGTTKKVAWEFETRGEYNIFVQCE